MIYEAVLFKSPILLYEHSHLRIKFVLILTSGGSPAIPCSSAQNKEFINTKVLHTYWLQYSTQAFSFQIHITQKLFIFVSQNNFSFHERESAADIDWQIQSNGLQMEQDIHNCRITMKGFRVFFCRERLSLSFPLFLSIHAPFARFHSWLSRLALTVQSAFAHAIFVRAKGHVFLERVPLSYWLTWTLQHLEPVVSPEPDVFRP